MAAQCCGWGGKKKRKGGGEEGSFGRNTTSDGEGRIDGALSYKLSSPCAQMLCPKRREGSGFVASFCLLRRPRLLKAPFLFFSLLLGSLRSTFPTFPPSSVWPYFPPFTPPFFSHGGGQLGRTGAGLLFLRVCIKC